MKKTILCIVLAALYPFFKVSGQVTNNNTTTLTKNIAGKVTDEEGKPLPGATVKIQNESVITITDKDGRFTFNNASLNGSLTVSFIGFQTTNIPIPANSINEIIIQLKADANSLNEVQVIGYGTTTKRLNTGSVSTISAADIEKQPVANVLSALQGRVSGVAIQTQNGLPGGNVSVQIRGQGSISASTDPLYVIDGIPFLSSPVQTGISAVGDISPLSIINPGDIQSVDILKDADATAIYGSRGANGVILITTKKGQVGKTEFSFNVTKGISEISRYNTFLSLPEYLQMRNEAYKNDGLMPSASDAPDLLVWSQSQSTDWQKYEFGNKAALTTVQGSLSGGTAENRFILSGNYRDEGSILPGNEDYQKGGGYLNFIHTSLNKRFTAAITANYETDDNHTLYNATTSIANLPPNYPIYNSDGSYNFQANYNPVALLDQRSRILSNNLLANLSLKFQLLDNLFFKADLGYTKYVQDQLATLPQSSQSDLYFVPDATAYQTHNSSDSYIIEPQFNYSVNSKYGNISALAGGTLQRKLDQGNVLTETGVNNPDLLGNLDAASLISGATTYNEYKYLSLFGRINYNWQQKYLVDLNFRRDGSSRFGSGRQFGNFGAVGAAWIFSEEKAVKDNFTFLSFGKLRSSYGITGNDQIGDYQYLSSYSSNSLYGGTASLIPSRIANPNYGWESTKQFEAALDLGFFNNRILFNTAWFQRRSDNQLVTYPLPYQSGFSGYVANLPAVVQNSGWEFELNTVNIKSTNFSWTSAFNITIPKNKLVSFPNLAGSNYANQLVVGQDLSIVRGFHFIGVNPQTGNPEFEDINHDSNIQYPDDIITIGKTSPTLFGGFNNTFSYLGLQVSFFIEFRKQHGFGYTPGYGALLENEPAYILGRWQQPGGNSSIPRYTTSTNDLGNLNGSNATFIDASYIRVKNVEINYLLPASFTHKLNVKSLNLYLQGQNLLTFDNKKSFDPEISGNTGAIPPLRIFVAGLRLTL
jgi:TonB-linked SusC/RagA family outer membrane protein